uniref:RING-type domain-containing protein n=1 Tax=Acrobeloides nanus TaxID=290746 RepID=A0A914CQ15_9BILA
MADTTRLNEGVDLCIVTDATVSMGEFLTAVKGMIPQMIGIMKLTKVFKNFGIFWYRDYADNPIYGWSGWINAESEFPTKFLDELKPPAGGDIPEASKTAFVQLLNHVTRRTYVLHFTDAPPHHDHVGSKNVAKERELLKENFDWVKICHKLRQANVSVYSITDESRFMTASFYVMLAEITKGNVLYVKNISPRIITQVSINLFLALMGCESQFESKDVVMLEFPNQFDLSKVIDENLNSGGYLPSAVTDAHQHKEGIKEKLVQLNPQNDIATNLKTFVKRISVDESYRNLVYEVFEELFTPQTILALTYNSIFGAFWREICKRRDDSRRDTLLTKMDMALAKMGTVERDILKEWIADSYNRLEEINEIISIIQPQFPAFVIDTDEKYTPKEMLEIARSCMPSVLAKISSLMNNLRIMDAPSDDKETTDITYLPVAISNKNLFSYLPHLMAEGTVFSLRPSAIMAIIAVFTGNVLLKERALEFLNSIKGKWIDFENVPENYTFEFVKLVLKVPEVLTDDEVNTMRRLQKIAGFMINGKSNLLLKQPFSPEGIAHPDNKSQCKKCGEWRSFTLMLENGVCGLCSRENNPDYGINNKERLDNNTSYLYECRRCKSLYAVANVDGLKCQPKCHYCRQISSAKNEKLPDSKNASGYTIECTNCKNNYSSSTKLPDLTQFKCPPCVADPTKAFKEIQVSVQKFMEENREAILDIAGLDVPSTIDIFCGLSLYKNRNLPSRTPSESLRKLVYHGKPVLNPEAIKDQLLRWIFSGGAELGTCMLCFEEKGKHNIRPVCGRKNCQTFACNDCLTSWYGGQKPGHIIHIPRLTCPFCKCCPNIKIAKAFNKHLCELLKITTPFDPTMYYAWCMKCYKPVEYAQKSCLGAVPELDGKWACEKCTDSKLLNREKEIAKQCPNEKCQQYIVKASGCNHITCICGTHWCYECVKPFNQGLIYDHMYKEHGSYGGYEENDYLEEYE